MNTAENLDFYYKRLADLWRCACVGALLGWDLQVYMPAAAAQARADQIEVHVAVVP